MAATMAKQMNGVSNVSLSNVNGNENGMNGICYADESGLAFIDCDTNNPLELFKDWFDEAKRCSCLLPEALVLSTSTLDGKVSSRSLLLRRLEEDGIVVMTDSRSRKVREIKENPRVAMVFLWVYKLNGVTQNKQVRIEGRIEELTRPRYQDLYDREPFFCKVRAHICHQDSPTEWDDLKEKHDTLVQKVQQKEVDLPMPEHFVAFKVYPDFMEFYYGKEKHIADRILFKKDKPNVDWHMQRLTA